MDNRFSSPKAFGYDLADSFVAFFDRTVESVFGLLNRKAVEDRLRAHFTNEEPTCVQNAAWYALRNTIYATGCKITIGDEGRYADAHSQALRYFQNALSVYADLLCDRTTASSIEALAIMVSSQNCHNSEDQSNRK